MLSARDSLQIEIDTQRLKEQGWKKIFFENGDKQKAGILMPDKIDFKTKAT